MAIKIYENGEIYVRPFKDTDITERYLKWFHDQEVCKYNSHGKMSNQPSLKMSDTGKTLIWAVLRKADIHYKEILIGKVVLNIDWINRNAEFTCIFGEKEYWRKGYCTQVLEWMINHGLNKLNLYKIWLGTARSNTGMISAALNCDMIQEGELSNHVFLNGKYESIKQFAAWHYNND